jgi:hypothetical protein
METFLLKCDGDRDLKFKGELIASASSSDDRERQDYSGSVGRWSTMSLYMTEGGKYIATHIRHTRWRGERTSYSTAVLDDSESVIEFFGQDWLAKRLYEVAEIENVTTVE